MTIPPFYQAGPRTTGGCAKVRAPVARGEDLAPYTISQLRVTCFCLPAPIEGKHLVKTEADKDLGCRRRGLQCVTMHEELALWNCVYRS